MTLAQIHRHEIILLSLRSQTSQCAEMGAKSPREAESLATPSESLRSLTRFLWVILSPRVLLLYAVCIVMQKDSDGEKAHSGRSSSWKSIQISSSLAFLLPSQSHPILPSPKSEPGSSFKSFPRAPTRSGSSSRGPPPRAELIGNH